MTGKIGMEPERVRQIYDSLVGLSGERDRELRNFENCLRRVETENTDPDIRETVHAVSLELEELRILLSGYNRCPDILMAYIGKFSEMNRKACAAVSSIRLHSEG